MEQRTFKYDFFISYKHGKRDSRISGYLQKKLEDYKIPKEIQKRCGKEKITRVFRDKEELSVTVDLTQEIEEQLKNTEYLIVMCSPQSKQSMWVNREVETFLKYRGWEHVLPVLIEGEPKDAFPEILNEREMLAADVRGMTFAQIKRKCKHEMLRLLAPALKCSYDELRQRNRTYASRRMAAIAIGLAAVAVGFGAYAWNQSVQIQENYWQKMKNQAGLLAGKSSELLESGDRDAALLVALEALPKSESNEEKPLVGKAQIALEDALYLYDQKFVTKPRAMHTLKMDNSMKEVYALNEERDVLISCDEKNIIYVWNLEDGSLKCRYTGFHEMDEDCKGLLGGTGAWVYISSDSRVVCFDYETQEVLWELLVEEHSQNLVGYWEQWVLSPEKDKLALAGRDEVWVVDAESGELQDYYRLQQEDWYAACLEWNPNGKELALADEGSWHQGCVLLLDLESGQQKIMKTFENWSSVDIAYKTEDVLTCVWTDMNNYSLGRTFDYADYYVAEIDCRLGETIWEMEKETVIRDTQPEIQHVYEEEAGELYDLTIVTIGSEVIAIRDGELWAEFAYDSAIVGRISYGLMEIHITQNGVVYLMDWELRFIMNERYDTRELGLENVYTAEGIAENGIVAFPGFGGGTLYVYTPVQDEAYVEVENSEEATYIYYSPNRKYRIASDASDEDYNDIVLNVWDMESGEHVYRQEFFYDYESKMGELLKNFGFLNDQYFFYNTLYQIVICDVNTWEQVAVYDQPIGENSYNSQIDQVCSAEGENPGIYFLDKGGTLYYFPLQGDGVRVILDSGKQKEIYAEHYPADAYGFYFTANPTGTHVFFTCSPYCVEDTENKILIWDVEQEKLCGEFMMSYDTYNGFRMEFSEDGKEMLFQNKEQGLQVMNLEDGCIETVPLQGENHQGYWFSDDKRYIFAYTYDYFLKIYDRRTQSQTMNLECDAATLENWYFEGDNLYITVTYSMSQPVMNCYRETEAGVYECFSTVGSCELIVYGKAYVRPGSTNELYCYPHRELDEMISMAKEILDGRELTQIERQRYSIDQ